MPLHLSLMNFWTGRPIISGSHGNLWWPGLTFENPEDTQALFSQVHYEKKGFMLDTGHYLHTNLDLHNQDEAVDCLHQMLDHHKRSDPIY